MTDGTPPTGVPHKLGVLTPGRVPHDEVVLEVLRREFSALDVDAVTSTELLAPQRRSLAFRMGNRMGAYRDFGPHALRRRRRITDYSLWTGQRFDAIRSAAAKRFSGGGYAFTFQTESLFDGSVPGIPHVVYTFHGILASLDYPGFDRRDVLPRAWIDRETSIYRNATVVLTRSEHVARVLVERYGIPSEKVACVYSGGNVPPPADPPVLDAARYAAKRILFVGLRWEVKGGPQLVEAFRRALEVHPDASLTIVGCSPPVDAPNCRVVGSVPVADLAAYYERASVLCVPAIREAASCNYFEALSYGLPVVASDFGAIPEFVRDGETGYRVRCDDVAALADRLIALLDDPELCRRLGAGGYALAHERYNWESTGARIRQHVERVVDLPVAVS